MSEAGRKFVIGLLLFLAVGIAIGFLYDRPLVGFSVAALAALLWHVRQLLSFDRALRGLAGWLGVQATDEQVAALRADFYPNDEWYRRQGLTRSQWSP